jgi:flagellar hook-basal body complex protein FliE
MSSAIDSVTSLNALNAINQVVQANRGILMGQGTANTPFQEALQNAWSTDERAQPATTIQKTDTSSQDTVLGQGTDVFSGQGMIGSIFQNAVQNVRDTDADLVQAQYLLATGQLDNPATATLAATKNELAVDLLVQLRSRALDAYSTLTQITL